MLSRQQPTQLVSKVHSSKPAMQLTPFFTALLASLSIVGVASAAIRPIGAPDGVYLHVVDADGAEHLQYVGAFNSTIGYVVFAVVFSVPSLLTESFILHLELAQQTRLRAPSARISRLAPLISPTRKARWSPFLVEVFTSRKRSLPTMAAPLPLGATTVMGKQ